MDISIFVVVVVVVIVVLRLGNTYLQIEFETMNDGLIDLSVRQYTIKKNLQSASKRCFQVFQSQ